MSGVIGVASIVITVLDTWDAIDKKRDEYKRYTLLANELKEFGVQERREALRVDLELAYSIIRDPSRSKDDVLDLDSRSKRLAEILDGVLKAADIMYRKRDVLRHVIHRSGKVEELKAQVASFDEQSARFHQVLISLSITANNTPALLIRGEDLVLMGYPPKIVGITETTYTARASHIQPEHPEPKQVDVLIEKIHYTTISKDETSRAIKILASKLKPALPHWNIPRLFGYRNNQDEIGPCMELVFEHPQPKAKLISLDQLYRDGTLEPTLNLRLRLCNQIAVAVLQAHVLGLVHKNIRPQNLLVSFEIDEEGVVEQASLVLSGWINARLIEGMATKRISDSAVSKIIYQHPNRRLEGNMAKEDYNIGHDIYSMGVCMLELLTWDTLVRPGDTEMAAPVLSGAYQREFTRLGYARTLDVPSNDDLSDDEDTISLASLYTQDAKEVQNTLVSMAKTYVPKRAGNRMASLIHRCLTCLDPESGPFTASPDKKVVAENFRNEIFEDFNKLLAVL
ncbi:hypothetical protein F5B19DRAFT_201679 [Rostrohypoxylon terebratum]|nr:hypothetical protein F5B19DRAFT_201679 [Rostrohypoxylon terebratum]